MNKSEFIINAIVEMVIEDLKHNIADLALELADELSENVSGKEALIIFAQSIRDMKKEDDQEGKKQ